MNSSLIELSNLRVSFGTQTVLSGVTLAVTQGEIVVIEGATGAGKTTLIRVLLGAEHLQAGTARVLDTDLNHASVSSLVNLRRRIGVVFQSPRFMDQDSVLANVSVPLAIAGRPLSHCRAEGTRALLDANLLANARKKPTQLSGGELARLQIARALIHRPYLVLADEPFAHLDPDSAIEEENLLAAAHAKGTTIVITTHRPTRLAENARRLRLEGGVLV